MQSSSRNGAPVLWIALHTTEGILTVAGLRAWKSWPGSSHAAADATGALADGAPDGFVDYSRASWTLRGGNPYSDNLELCGFAGWTRAQWLERPLLLRRAAEWIARRCRARGITRPRRLGLAEIRGRQVAGVIDHGDYTDATGDGTHWDVGNGFPWDLVLADAQTILTGQTPAPAPIPLEDDPMLTFVTDAPNHPWWCTDGAERWYAPPGRPQLLVDLGLARSVAVKLIPSATLGSFPLRQLGDVVDEQAIVDQVVARIAALTPQQRKAELSYAIPTPAYVADQEARGYGAANPLSDMELEASADQPAHA